MAPMFHMPLACSSTFNMLCLIRLLYLYVVSALCFNREGKSFQYLLHPPCRLLSDVWAHVGDRLPPVECAKTCCLRLTPIEFAWINKNKRTGLSVVFDLSHIVKMPRLTGCIWVLWDEFQYSALVLLHFFIWHPSRADICQRWCNVFLICSIKHRGSAFWEMSTQSNRTQKQMVMTCRVHWKQACEML